MNGVVHAFDTWRSKASEARRARSILGRAVKRMSGNMLFRAINFWRERVGQAAVLRRVIARMSRGALASAWGGWLDGCRWGVNQS